MLRVDPSFEERNARDAENIGNAIEGEMFAVVGRRRAGPMQDHDQGRRSVALSMVLKPAHDRGPVAVVGKHHKRRFILDPAGETAVQDVQAAGAKNGSEFPAARLIGIDLDHCGRTQRVSMDTSEGQGPHVRLEHGTPGRVCHNKSCRVIGEQSPGGSAREQTF